MNWQKWQDRLKNLSLGENMVYGLVWAAIFLIPFMNAHLMSEEINNLDNVIISWGKISPYFLIFLLNNYILAPYLLLRHRYVWYAVTLLAVVGAIFGTIEVLDFRYWQSDIDLRSKASLTELEWYWNLLFGVMMAGANTMIKLYYRAIKTDQRMAVLERENIETQMEYLKYQINPHFLMNTLNNIHAMIDFDSDMAKKSVMDLSRMLRHILYDSDEQYTTLDKEVAFLENYIELMRIRYIDEVNIKLNTPDMNICRKIKLPPLLFIVLVENAFKHGISYDKQSFIYIDIATYGKMLSCTVTNSRHPARVSQSSGIGLKNISRRLKLLFDSNYKLRIEDDNEDIYRVELVIPITNRPRFFLRHPTRSLRRRGERARLPENCSLPVWTPPRSSRRNR